VCVGQARQLRDALAERLGSLGLELHPGKTKIVYCQDAKRRGEAEHTSFDFLGYTFRGRLVRGRRGFFVSFSAAMSTTARKAEGRLFMHYAFDRWMDREHPGCPFERYADDVVVHCDTEEQGHSPEDPPDARHPHEVDLTGPSRLGPPAVRAARGGRPVLISTRSWAPPSAKATTAHSAGRRRPPDELDDTGHARLSATITATKL
jgi:hypothetical protein